MATIEDQVVYLGVRIGELQARLEHNEAIVEVEFRLAAQERATLAARLDALTSNPQFPTQGKLPNGEKG